jgi:enoyl-CoA hydratase/carnithine racemase
MTASKTSQPLVLRNDDEGVRTLTLNRPASRNPLSMAMIGALLEQLDDAAVSTDIKVVVIAAAGPAFCAGHDLGELRAADQVALEQLFDACSELMLGLNRLPQPVIASVQGVATAAGCQLVASCDLALAASGASFATPGVHIGLFCSTPMVALSRAVAAKPAMEMLLTGDPVSAERALSIGLVNQVVPPESLATATSELANRIAARPTRVVRTGKPAFYRQIEVSREEAYRYTARIMVENMLGEDAREGVSAFLEKRKPDWRDN